MAQDKQQGRRAGGRIVVAGMVVAAVLGAGLGVWARSAPPPAHQDAEPEPPLRPLQIVVEDALPPIGQLLEVLPPELAAAAASSAPAAGARLAAAQAVSPLPVVPLRRVADSSTSVDARKPAAKSKAPPARLAKADPKPAAKVEKAKAVERAEAPKTKAAPAPRRPSTALAEASKAKAPPERRRGKPAAAKPPVQLAKASPPKKAAPARPAPRRDEPARLARNACAMPDPGAALVCADQRLGARDRQLQRAYRRAEAAGVPASALRRREARWLEVRAAAAREAPWAVEDVYVARISEVNDMIRDAREN